MSNKFTEEQYQEIIRTYENNYGYEYKVMAVIRVVDGFNFNNNLSYNESVAIANPLTREWAHDQFVEKEKRYYWTGRKEDDLGFLKRLYKDDEGMIVDRETRKEDTDKAEDEQLNETEIREWGYNPEMFDKEEVD